MPITLNDELQKLISTHGNQPVEFVHPVTQQVYLLVPREAIVHELPEAQQRLRAFADSGRRVGWDDSIMDDYDHYDEVHNSSS